MKAYLVKIYFNISIGQKQIPIFEYKSIASIAYLLYKLKNFESRNFELYASQLHAKCNYVNFKKIELKNIDLKAWIIRSQKYF